jgi:hypothetical protein
MEHQEEPLLSLVELGLSWRSLTTQHVSVEPHTLGIVDVEHAPQRSEQVSLIRFGA